MSEEGKVLATFAIPASTARGAMVSGAGTLSATLRAIGCAYEGTSASETLGQLQICGFALALGGDTSAAGVPLRSDASGKLVATAADGTDADLTCAIALQTMADGKLCKVKLI